MNVKKVGFLCGIIFSFLPTFVNATNIHLYNKTNSYLTGGAGFLCSASMGLGALKPKGDVDIQESEIKKLCPFGTCGLNIYMNENCSGNSIATIKVNKNDGVVGIENHDNPDHYSASGSGALLVVTGGPAKSWFNFFFS